MDQRRAQGRADFRAAADIDQFHRVQRGQHIRRADRQAGAAETGQDVGGERFAHPAATEGRTRALFSISLA